MICFHGTSYESYLKIKEEGFKNEDTNWYCSEPGETYLFKAFDDSEDEVLEAQQKAAESALIAAARQNSKKKKAVVLKFELDDELFEYDADFSSGDEYTMADKGAIVVDNYNLKGQAFEVIEIPYYPGARYIYLAGIISNPLLNITELKDEEINIIKEIQVMPNLSDLLFFLKNDF